MLFTITSIVDFLGMGVALWLALYLLGRGFPSRITLRAVGVLFALAAFFLGAYINLYIQIPGTAAVRAVLLTISLSLWNDLTHKLLPLHSQRTHRWPVVFVSVLGFVTVILLLWARTAFVGEEGNVLWVARMGINPPYVIYGLFQLSASSSILYNLSVGIKRAEAGSQTRYFWAASLLAVSTVGYGVLALALTPPMPRLIQDALILSSISVLGVSVARHQTLVERRATLQDFPISGLAVLCLSAIYLFVAWQARFSPVAIILFTSLAILTHSAYNLVREFLDRLRSKDESAFRYHLRQLENNVGEGLSLRERLQGGLRLLCQTLEASGAFIAVPNDLSYIVLASYRSIPVGRQISVPKKEWNDISEPSPQMADQAAWLAPAYHGGDLMALVGIGLPRGRLHYSEDDLDLLVETADRVGTIIFLEAQKPVSKDRLRQIVSDSQLHEADLQAKSDELIATLVTNPDPQFVKMVEEGLRNLPDFIRLGQSALAEHLVASNMAHLERGKAVQRMLIQAMEALRPAQDCPHGPVPREWYSYTVLHDAYWKQTPNHDIMSKLYISEGTFHRTRRAAVRSVARTVLEMHNLRTN